MRHTLVALAAVCFLVASARGQGESREAKPLLVGVVDVSVVFKKYKRREALEKDVNATKEDFEKQAQQQQHELEALRSKLAGSEGKTDPHVPGELKHKLAAFKGWRDGAEERLKMDADWMVVAILSDMDAEIRRYAKEKGFDLILRANVTNGYGDDANKVVRAQAATLVAFADSLDVTDAIVERLNARQRAK